MLPLLFLAQPSFELRDGDRVVFVGNTFIEREQDESYIETLLTAQYPDSRVTFRNLGWSGDTVWGHARAVFGKPEDGFAGLQKMLADLKPTMIFAGYGMSESFEGEPGLAKFEAGLARLLDGLSALTDRIVLISPIRHEHLGPPLPDPAEHNKKLRLYVDALAKAAQARRFWFVNLFDGMEPKTDNGIHLTAEGYRRAAKGIAEALRIPQPRPLNHDEGLRRTIVAKNRLCFDQWRAQNVTYLFGFRRHEQGRNAVEIPQFDLLIAAKEAEIEKLKKK